MVQEDRRNAYFSMWASPSRPGAGFFVGDELSTSARQRRYFPLPQWRALDAETQAVALAAQAAWEEVASVAAEVEWPAAELAPHPLIDWFTPTVSNETPARDVMERQALHLLHARSALVLTGSSPSAFVDLLEALATAVTGSSQAVRSAPIATDPDAGGVRIVFPPSDTLHGRLGRLHHYIRHSEGPTVMAAAVALVAITNAHPFIDGNGRSGRVLFNLVMNRDQRHLGAVAIPLHAIGNRPPGNLTLYMRGAELRGDWGSLLNFLFKAITSGR